MFDIIDVIQMTKISKHYLLQYQTLLDSCEMQAPNVTNGFRVLDFSDDISDEYTSDDWSITESYSETSGEMTNSMQANVFANPPEYSVCAGSKPLSIIIRRCNTPTVVCNSPGLKETEESSSRNESSFTTVPRVVSSVIAGPQQSEHSRTDAASEEVGLDEGGATVDISEVINKDGVGNSIVQNLNSPSEAPVIQKEGESNLAVDHEDAILPVRSDLCGVHNNTNLFHVPNKKSPNHVAALVLEENANLTTNRSIAVLSHTHQDNIQKESVHHTEQIIEFNNEVTVNVDSEYSQNVLCAAEGINQVEEDAIPAKSVVKAVDYQKYGDINSDETSARAEGADVDELLSMADICSAADIDIQLSVTEAISAADIVSQTPNIRISDDDPIDHQMSVAACSIVDLNQQISAMGTGIDTGAESQTSVNRACVEGGKSACLPSPLQLFGCEVAAGEGPSTVGGASGWASSVSVLGDVSFGDTSLSEASFSHLAQLPGSSVTVDIHDIVGVNNSCPDSPLLFSSDDESTSFSEEVSRGIEAALAPSPTPTLVSVISSEKMRLNKLQELLMGAPPPPSITLPPFTASDILEVIKEKAPWLTTGAARDQRRSAPPLWSQEAASAAWPLAKCLQYPGIHYNHGCVSEQYEGLCQKLLSRCVGAETASSVTVWSSFAPPAPRRERRSLPARRAGAGPPTGLSPGRRLSHLARRHRTFSSSNLLAEGARLQSSQPHVVPERRTILVDVKKKESKRTRSSQKKKCVQQQDRAQDIAATKLNSSKRALFQSPDEEKKKKKPSPSHSKFRPSGSSAGRSRRALFSDGPSEAKGAGSSKKRAREESDDEMCKKLPRRKLFCDAGASVRSAAMEGQPSCSKQSSASEERAVHNLSDYNKRKLLWAVAEALKKRGVSLKDSHFHVCAKALATRCKSSGRLQQVLSAHRGSTSDRMLEVAMHFVDEVLAQYSASGTGPS